jgi:hypothetical protein
MQKRLADLLDRPISNDVGDVDADDAAASGSRA